jgi:uncharacterized protein YbcC (UPF0753/DUF2309 family)
MPSLRTDRATPAAQQAHAGADDADGPSLSRLRHAIDHAAHLLPAQGPITVFIHHNTLHALEDLPFDEAVQRGGKIFGCEPYLSEDRYRQELLRGRIRFAGLDAVLREDLAGRGGETIAGLCTRLELRQAMLQYPLRVAPAEELRWYIAETDALRRVRPEASAAVRAELIAETRHWVMRDLRGHDETAPPWVKRLFDHFHESAIEAWGEGVWEEFTLRALWEVCCDGVRGVPPPASDAALPVRHRDLLLRAAGVDTDLPVNEVLTRFCAAFLDQGVGHWQLPGRDKGLYQAFCSLYRMPGRRPTRWLAGLHRELARLQDGHVGALQSARESLELLGVPESDWDEFLSATLLALRGWAGMVWHLEERGDRVAHPVPEGSLIDYVAVRLVLERLALDAAAREALPGYEGPLAGLRAAARRRLPAKRLPGVEERAFVVFQLAQVLGWTPSELHRLGAANWAALFAEIEVFSGLERRRVFHKAYERRFNTRSLDALALHRPFRPTWAGRPRFQVITCLDEREESFRRHLEEAAPDCETFSTAGFYGIAMYYRGAADAHFVPLCPIVIKPGHWVQEQLLNGEAAAKLQRTRARKALGEATHRFHVGSRSFAVGAVLTASLGVLATIPLILRVLFPRLAADFSRRINRFVHAPGKTRLKLERDGSAPGPEEAGQGYTVEEMINIAEGVLRETGLTKGLARLVVTLGHGSHSMNNPHESAHDCGACGGAVGGPNGRAIAQILNDRRVREGLARRGLAIPEDTVFVGGLHNTCNEYVKLADLDRVPESHRALLAEVENDIEEALSRNAHERARRFESAPLSLSSEGARQHMDARAEDLAQVRPEWGHATNALCLVGRRERTRGLYLDRRAFLTSYDPKQDDAECGTLARILAAAFPVCAGISLEYYFGHVDPSGYGCGTKLPHNIASLLGVMDGAASDLRTGLPWQMVEIHEPMRLLFVIETTPAAMLGIMARNKGIETLCRNGWVHLAVQDPDSQEIQVFEGGAFRPYRPQADRLPRAASSRDWYRGWRYHLEYAEIGS